MDEKLRFIFQHDAGESMAEMCRRFGILRETGYVWLRLTDTEQFRNEVRDIGGQ